MSLWEDIFGSTVKGQLKKAKNKTAAPARDEAPLTASPALLQRAAGQQGPSFMEEAGSFFKPAGVFGKNLADMVLSPGETTGFTDLVRHRKDYRDTLPTMNPAEAMAGDRMPSLAPLASAVGHGLNYLSHGANTVAEAPTPASYLPPVQLARAVMHPADTWNRVFHGTNPGDGDLGAVLGSRGAEKWQGAQDQIDRVAAVNKTKPLAQRLSAGTPAEQYFNPESPDIFSAGQDAGLSAPDSLLMSLLNPMETLSGEGGEALAGKLAGANKVRKAINTVGRVMDPVTLGMDAVGHVAGKAATAIHDWRLPGKAVPLSTDEIARRAGLDANDMRRYAQGDAALPPDEVDHLLTHFEAPPAGDAVAARIQGLTDGLSTSKLGTPEWEAAIRNAPRETTPTGDATAGHIQGLLDETSQGLAQQRPIDTAIGDATAGRVEQLASGHQDEVDQALSHFDNTPMQPLSHFDGTPLQGGEIGQAAQDLGHGIPGEAPGSPRPGLVEPGAAPLTSAGSPAVGLVDSLPTPGAAEVASDAGGSLSQHWPDLTAENVLNSSAKITGQADGMVKLSVNPVMDWVKGLGNFARGDTMMGAQAAVNKSVDSAIASSKVLTDFRYTLKRVFSTEPGRVGAELGDKVNEFSMQRNGIMRRAADTIYEQLKTGDDKQRAVMQSYMNGSMTKQDAGKFLSPDFISAADSVRYMMDKAGNDYVATSLGLEKDYLAQASLAEKDLIRQVYETFDNTRTNVGFNAKTQKPIMRGRKKVLLTAQASHAQPVIDKAVALVDGAMSRMTAQGFVKDGRIVDMGLDMGAWINNLGKYEPRMYKAIQYGVDLSQPGGAMAFIDAIDARQAGVADILNQARAASGLPPVAHVPISDDLRQFILAHYTGDGAGWSRGVAEEAGRFMKRKELSQEMRDILGPLVNPAYTYMKGVQHVHLMENTMKMRRWVANSEDLVSRVGETVEDFMKRTNTDMKDIAFDFSANPQYASQVGALGGRFIHRDAANLMASTGIVPHLTGPDALDYYKSVSRGWLAVVKVLANPVAHSKQNLENALTVYQNAGLRGVKDMMDGFKDVRGKSQDYLEARDAGLFSAGHDEHMFEHVDTATMPEFTYDGNEMHLAQIARGTDWLSAVADQARKAYSTAKNTIGNKVNAAGAAYAFGDDVAKLAMYKHYKAQGFPPIEAAKKAADNIYTGTANTAYERFMAGLGTRSTQLDRGARNPWYGRAEVLGAVTQQTFFGAQRFAWEQGIKGLAGIKAGANWMPMTDPGKAARVWGLMMGAYGMGEMMKHYSGEAPGADFKNKPDWMRGLLPMQMKLPSQFSQMISGPGQHDWLDYSSIAPQGQMSQGRFSVGSGKMSTLTDNAVSTFVPLGATVMGMASSNPSESGSNAPLNPLLKIFVEQALDKDTFTGRKITTQPGGRFAHAWRNLLPDWMPNPAGLMEAIHSMPDNPRDPQQWQEMGRTALQGLASESPSLASRIIAGAANSYDYWALGNQLATSRRILDNKGRQVYLAKALVPFLGVKIVSQAEGEADKSRARAQHAIVAQMKKELGDRIRNMQGKQRDDAILQYRKTAAEIMSGKPTPRFYEGAGDTLTNLVNAARGILSKQNSDKGLET